MPVGQGEDALVGTCPHDGGCVGCIDWRNQASLPQRGQDIPLPLACSEVLEVAAVQQACGSYLRLEQILCLDESMICMNENQGLATVLAPCMFEAI